MAVPLSTMAAADLETIGDVIARDNPGRAPALVHAMRAHVLALDRNPDIGAPVRVLAGALLRRRKALTWGPPLPRIAGLHSADRFRRG